MLCIPSYAHYTHYTRVTIFWKAYILCIATRISGDYNMNVAAVHSSKLWPRQHNIKLSQLDTSQ
jgi:hypothetical protein